MWEGSSEPSTKEDNVSQLGLSPLPAGPWSGRLPAHQALRVRLGGSLLTEKESWGAAQSAPCLAWAPAPALGCG